MPIHLATTDRGIGLLADGHVRLVRTSYPDLGAALADGQSLADLAAAPVLDEVALDEVRLLAPVPRPRQIWAVGLNYRAHAAEIKGMDLTEPFVFPKSPLAVVGPGDEVRLPRTAPGQVDFEGEMALVIGRQAEGVRADQVADYVAGLTICNDVSARSVQKGGPGVRANISLAKSFPTFAPLGPVVALFETVPDPEDLRIETRVNGEVRQSATTAALIFGLGELIEYISARVPLLPGDIIATGTPEGVGDVDGRYLAPGDTVRIELADVGVLENPIVADHSVAGA